MPHQAAVRLSDSLANSYQCLPRKKIEWLLKPFFTVPPLAMLRLSEMPLNAMKFKNNLSHCSEPFFAKRFLFFQTIFTTDTFLIFSAVSH